MIRKIHSKDKKQWEKLYKGYAVFYKVEMNDHILQVVWNWLNDKNHELKGIGYEIDEKIVDQKRNKVNGSVKLKLYKGNITIVSRQTRSNAYSMKKVSFEENKTFNKSNVERFINFHKKKLR